MSKAFAYNMNNWSFRSVTIIEENTQVTHQVSRQKPRFGGGVEGDFEVETTVGKVQCLWVQLEDGKEAKITLNNPVMVRCGQHAILAGLRDKHSDTYRYLFMYILETGEFFDIKNINKIVGFGCFTLILFSFLCGFLLVQFFIVDENLLLYMLKFNSDSILTVFYCFVIGLIPAAIIIKIYVSIKANKLREHIFSHIINNYVQTRTSANL